MRIGMNLPGPFWISANIGGRRRRRPAARRTTTTRAASTTTSSTSSNGCALAVLAVIALGLFIWLMTLAWWIVLPAALGLATYKIVLRMEAKK